MSSDEEDFNMDVSGDESDFAPAAKKAPAKKVRLDLACFLAICRVFVVFFPMRHKFMF